MSLEAQNFSPVSSHSLNLLLQVNTVLLNTEVTFPSTAGSALATAAASSLATTLTSNPGQVYTASGAALLASAVVAITNVSQASSLVTSLVAPSAQIAPGPAPVQYLLTENLVRRLALMHSAMSVLYT